MLCVLYHLAPASLQICRYAGARWYRTYCHRLWYIARMVNHIRSVCVQVLSHLVLKCVDNLDVNTVCTFQSLIWCNDWVHSNYGRRREPSVTLRCTITITVKCLLWGMLKLQELPHLDCASMCTIKVLHNCYRYIFCFIINIIFLFTTIIMMIISSNRGNSRQLFITYIDGLGCAGTHLPDWRLHYTDDILWFAPPPQTARWHWS